MQVKGVFLHYLNQLDRMLAKINQNHFPKSLSDDMFSLAVNARVAANFALRGYCPLIGEPIPNLDSDTAAKQDICRQIQATIQILESCANVASLDDSILITDKAGFTEVSLPQSEYVFHYIVPNFIFHISMVYAIARASGVPLGKSDFDGYHRYPAHFQFGNGSQ
ncbi:DUF1993 family protein [Alteromonas aestuariivivens]|uniref:DUF1993 family protein n=1 Tax=Alteromonas aestuariivivens TaxID=1938339 RepID=A0A3D8M9V0_9ALTE|nr:DUF1993 family protein [Alteromonas aestuariivivens]RDV26731.1 DUF1993 family protein [Alteromonas aestuariivivens]